MADRALILAVWLVGLALIVSGQWPPRSDVSVALAAVAIVSAVRLARRATHA